MDWADDITYAVHDLDDFARAGLIPLDQLAHDAREGAATGRTSPTTPSCQQMARRRTI